MDIEILNEPQPAPRASGKFGAEVTVRLIDSKTGEQVNSTTGVMKENERRTRE